jgi:hypothetical protein
MDDATIGPPKPLHIQLAELFGEREAGYVLERIAVDYMRERDSSRAERDAAKLELERMQREINALRSELRDPAPSCPSCGRVRYCDSDCSYSRANVDALLADRDRWRKLARHIVAMLMRRTRTARSRPGAVGYATATEIKVAAEAARRMLYGVRHE